MQDWNRTEQNRTEQNGTGTEQNKTEHIGNRTKHAQVQQTRVGTALMTKLGYTYCDSIRYAEWMIQILDRLRVMTVSDLLARDSHVEEGAAD